MPLAVTKPANGINRATSSMADSVAKPDSNLIRCAPVVMAKSAHFLLGGKMWPQKYIRPYLRKTKLGSVKADFTQYEPDVNSKGQPR